MADESSYFGCNYFLFTAFLLPVKWNENEQGVPYIEKPGVKRQWPKKMRQKCQETPMASV